MTGDLFLGLDLGSSSTKAVLVTADGEAVSAGAATLQTAWPQTTVRVKPEPVHGAVYDELYGWFRELAVATRPHAHALAAWQRGRSHGTMAVVEVDDGAVPASAQRKGTT